jgi:hypothetical protein
MARRVIRRTTDRVTTRKGSHELTVYRIEWPDGTPTGSGLFVNQASAMSYAREHGWPASFEREESEQCG